MLILPMVDDREWYGSVMLALLLATFVPAVATLVYKSPVERVLISMQEIAMELPQPQPAPQGASPAASSVASSDPEPGAAPPAVETGSGVDLVEDRAWWASEACASLAAELESSSLYQQYLAVVNDNVFAEFLAALVAEQAELGPVRTLPPLYCANSGGEFDCVCLIAATPGRA